MNKRSPMKKVVREMNVDVDNDNWATRKVSREAWMRFNHMPRERFLPPVKQCGRAEGWVDPEVGLFWALREADRAGARL